MKNIILKIASLPGFNYLFHLYCEYTSKEKKKSFGKENPDKVFYVIGQKERTGGLWWIVNKVIMHLAYADDNGYIPIIDYQNYWTQYHLDGELGNVNVWEKFFCQPSNYTLENISKSKNIIISDKKASPSNKYFMGNTDFYDNPTRLAYFQQIFRKYIRFSEASKKYLEEKKDEIIPNNERIVGVLCRGTDYLLKKPKNHPIQPNPEDVIEHVAIVMNEYNCKYVFVATEDEDILEQFKERFGDTLLFVNQKRINKEDMSKVDLIVDITKNNGEDKYIMGLNYLLSTFILSSCTCFIGGRTGGTKGVLLMQKGFEYCYVYNLGFYE